MTEWLQKWSAWVLVGAAIVAAILFPATGAGGIGTLIFIGALGIFAVDHGRRIPAAVLRPTPAIAGSIACGVIVIGAAAVFGRLLHDDIGWTMGDWGIQHAIVRDVIDGIHAGHLPTWSHALSTGDAPLETYPALTYLITGYLAVTTGNEDNLAAFLVVFAAIVHTLIAIGITRLCLRVAPAPIAAIAGLTQLIDGGSISAGGVAGNIEWALVHSALGQAFMLAAVVAVVDAVRRPRLRTSIAIWVFTALATATHPSALLSAGALIVALGVVALIASDVPARRPLAAAGHVALGLALSAVVWMPLGERLVAYGQHFPSPPHGPSDLLSGILEWGAPGSTFRPLMFIGHVGLVAALISRRAAPVLVGATGLLLFVGLIDTPYLLLDVGPGEALARLGAERFQSLCRPFVVAGFAYLIGTGLRLGARRWRAAGRTARRTGGAIAAISIALAVRAVLPFASDRGAEAAAEAERAIDPRGQDELVAWARAQVAATPKDRYARVLFDLGDVHYGYHLTAETGLPSFHLGATPNLLLREHIEDTSAASLKRFDVRWVVIADDRDSPPREDLESWERPNDKHAAETLALGDPATELVFGRYKVREVADWDGAFARVERGAGEVRVVTLADERVEIELSGTDQPALVALGIGFYPRWRAHDGAGRSVPVYALPTIPGGSLHVVSAWVRPGRTVFTADGALPSDGKGRGIAILAGLLAAGIVIVWSRRRWRWRVLRRAARARAWVVARRRLAVSIGAIALAVMLPIAGAVRSCAPARGLEVGTGLRGVAKVSARYLDGAFEDCGYSRLEGRYTCAGIAAVTDVIAGIVNDEQGEWPRHQGTWPFAAPAIQIEPLSIMSAEVKIQLDATLDGTYWAATRGGSATVQVGDDAPLDLASQQELGLAGRGDVSVHIEATVSGDGTTVAFIRKDAIDPARPYLVPPPETAPP